MEGPYFTFVRHPATWLRSFWAHNGQTKWLGRDKGTEHWAQVCWWTRDYQSEDFEEFAVEVVDNIPGIVSWFMSTYCQPKVVVGCMEDYPHSLKAVVPGLFCTKPPANKANKELPDISELLRTKIEASEPWLMKNYYENRDHHPVIRDWEYNFIIPDRGATQVAYMKGE